MCFKDDNVFWRKRQVCFEKVWSENGVFQKEFVLKKFVWAVIEKWVLAVLADGVAGRRADGRAPIRQPGRPPPAGVGPFLGWCWPLSRFLGWRRALSRRGLCQPGAGPEWIYV